MSKFDFQPDAEHEEGQFQPEENESPLASSSAEQRLGLSDQDAQISNERLRYVEELLRSAPLLSVPMGFADKVVAALRGKDTNDPDYKDGLGLILGLVVSIITTIGLFGVPAFLIMRVLITGDASTIVDDIRNFFDPIFGWIVDSPLVLLPVLLFAALSIVMLTGYFVWFMRDLMSSSESSEIK